MKAMNFRGPYRVRLDEKPEPRIEHPRDAVVRVTRTCICGSDLHLYHGLVPDTRIGTTFGHEFTGVVEQVGSEVQDLKVGDQILVPFNIACGQCHFCKQGLFGNCHESNPQATAVGGIFGYSHTAGGFDGGQAEYVRVPYADVSPMVIPEWMDPDDAVMLTDVVPTGYQAAEMAGIQPGDTVVIFGAGPIGIMAARCAWLFGAARVIVFDELEYRLNFVREYGPAEVYNFRELDVVMFMKKTTDGLGADVAIDAVGCEASGNLWQTLLGRKLKLQSGSAIALHWAINSVKKGGIVSVVGVYGGAIDPMPMMELFDRQVQLRMGQANVKRWIDDLLPLVEEEGDPLGTESFATHRLPLEAAPDAYSMFQKKEDGAVKVVLKP